MIKLNFRRILKSSVPIGTFTLFATLITFHLYGGPISLGNLQHIGWQAYDIVAPANTSLLPPARPPAASDSSSNSSTDWWDVDDVETEPNPTSFRLDVWNPLTPHHTGLTEIAIKSCFFSPDLVEYCDPRTTEEEDALKGKWVRVDRDLNAKSGRWWLSVWYRRSRRLDVPLITSLLILADDEIDLLPEPKSMWHKAPGSLTDGQRGSPKEVFLWYRLRPPLKDVTDDEEIESVITELDVLYGDSQPFYGFERVKPDVYTGDENIESAAIVYRRGVKHTPKAKSPHFKKDGKFKILQIADLHYSVNQGRCLQTSLTSCKYGDPSTDSLLSSILDAENPDLVVFTGDQLNGQGTSWDSKSVLAKFAKEVIGRNISWAAVMGNHDSEGGMLSREKEMAYLEALPFSLSKAGPSEVHGVGNYVLKIMSPDASKTHLLTLYFLDSGSYADKGWQWWKPTEYDWIHESQRDWFLHESSLISPIQRPFTPDGGKDLGGVWAEEREEAERRADTSPPAITLAKPNALVFFHIPLQEAYSDADTKQDLSTYEIGSQLDPPSAAKHNGGFFEEAILRARESENVASPTEVKAIANGHCHITDRCRRISGVWMCFGGGGSYSGYGKVGFDRRFRIYQMEDYGETIRTYKRTESGEIVDEQILAGKSAS